MKKQFFELSRWFTYVALIERYGIIRAAVGKSVIIQAVEGDNMNTGMKKQITALVLASFVSGGFIAPTLAHAGMVSPGQMYSEQQANPKARLESLLARQDVRQQLIKQGANPADVEQRVASLSDEEARLVADRMDQQPAGQGIVAAAVFIFLVLLATDILGLTDVFTFVKK
ncbi:PA2779 family protein [Pokkaliibacter plantistimulans]|nr:PA2779 family protein [Pokkaliibacter plantistimulans]